MSYRASFRCIAGCSGTHELWNAIYRCPACGDLLEVSHDLDALKKTSAAEWKTLFDSRSTLAALAKRSAVWSKREWICPEIADENIVSLSEGGTALEHAPRLAKHLGVGELFIKQCGNSHTGSFKDLGMTVLVSAVKEMIARGKSVRAIACASTGDTSAALAAYAATAGIPAVVLLPRGKISTAQLVQPLAAGARVLALDTDFDGCMKIVARLAEEGGVYLANSMNSLRLEGQKTVALEIAQQLGWDLPDVLVIPGGNLGNVSALAAGLDLLRALGLVTKTPRIVVAQAERANPLYRAFKSGWTYAPQKAEPTLASAIQIGAPVSINKAISALKRYDGLVEQASEADLADVAALADATGLYVCPHTAVALGALKKLVANRAIASNARVVVISTANALKFTDFKVHYHEGKLDGIDAARANKPIELPADIDAVRRALAL